MGVFVVNLHSVGYGRFGVVLSCKQLSSAQRADLSVFENAYVMHGGAVSARASACQPFKQNLVVNRQIYNATDVHIPVKGLCLTESSRKTVQNKPLGTVSVTEALLDDFKNNVVGDKLSLLHKFFYFSSERRVPFEIFAENFARGNLRNTEMGDHPLRLSAFSRSRRTQHNYSQTVSNHFSAFTSKSPCSVSS